MSIKNIAKFLSSKLDISEIFSEFSSDLVIVEDRIKASLSSDAKKLTEISTYLLDLGGKRIRPLMCLLSSRMFGMQTPSPEVIKVAAGIELIHMATLLHDDIIDKSPTRRGKPSAYLKFGSDATLLAGDLLFVRAFGLCGALDKYTIANTEEACIAVIEGEEIEGFLSATENYPMSRYMQVIEKKTSALFALSCKIGAHLAGASPQVVEQLHKFGILAGTSFQIVDDILDITADEKTLGKKPGNDLRQCTPTIINLSWMEKCPEEARDFFFNRESGKELDISIAIKSINNAGILEDARIMANDYSTKAKELLESLPNTQQKERDIFNSILEFTLERSH